MNVASRKLIGFEALLNRVTEPMRGRTFANDPPLRAEVFGLEQLVRHAKALAENHPVVTQRGANRLLTRLGDNEQILRAYNRATQVVDQSRRVTHAAEWLLDNFYLNSSTAATVSVTTQGGGGSTAIVRVNAGGGAFVDDAGNNWSADVGFNTGATSSTSSAITGTANDALYQSERYDGSSSPELIYSFNLPNGDYTVNLHFAEIYSGAARVGGRVFDVFVEGQSRIVSLDIFSRVGANAALILSLPVTVSDGQLNIAFVHGVENPKVSAIEVLSLAGTPAGASLAAMDSKSVDAPSPYQQWRRVHFNASELADAAVSANNSDPDGDRLDNLMEYALGLDPRVADVETRPTAQIENGFLVFTYARNKEATDVVLGVEAATLLAGPWSAAGLTQQVISDEGVIQTIKVIDPVAVSTAESRFLKLAVQLR